MAWSALRHFENGRFDAYVTFNGKKWVKHKTKITPHFIFGKSVFRYRNISKKQDMAAAAPYLNPVDLQIIASDKMLTYLAFPKIVQPTLLIRRQADLPRVLKKLKTTRVVLKPLTGAGGKGVQILRKAEAKKVKIKKTMVAQEFIDASAGVPGLYDDVHDFRLLFLGNKLFHAFIRTAAPGTLLCNVTQGGTRIVTPVSKVPAEMKKIARVVQNRFSHYENTFYSVDFMYGRDGSPRVIELNTTSGLDNAPGYDKHLVFVYNKLLDHIEKFV